jgi:chromosome partitioning protein
VTDNTSIIDRGADDASAGEGSRSRSGRILAVANQKGGVGKTTTAINLSTALAAVGRRVILFDLDPQGNASTGVGIDRDAAKIGSYEVLIDGAPLGDAVVETEIPNLFLVPASVDLSGGELELVDVQRREFRLKKAFEAYSQDFDYVLIDCPPALGLLTLNAFVASDGVMVPLQCEYLALEGLSQLVKTVERVRDAFNRSLSIQGIVLTMYDGRNNLSALVADDVRSYFGKVVYNTQIPRNVRVSEAPSHGRPVLLYDFQCSGAQAYVHLAGEVLRREEGINQ